MIRCTQCGAELPDGARFCSQCGAPVGISAVPEERRVVTVVFVDLVGFTERSDRADPEDVRRTLLPFHARAKEDIERFGGTLDKFIGDAVMGVFGAPVAHEDDPVRAVRAALRIVGSVDELHRADPATAVRVAVNTGEAVVAFGRGPQIGEAVAGDVVNTASRMQSLAPVGSVVVGESTARAIRHLFELEALPPATVKGKAQPLHVWRVLGERSASRAQAPPAAFVDRERELDRLAGLFDRAVGTPAVQVATVVAEPGLGKSRLLAELGARLADRARTLAGRCPAYGEGIAFAPVAETLRDLVGAGRTDPPSTVSDRIATVAARLETDPAERRWLASRLEAVLGVGDVAGGSTVSTMEIGDAWTRVIARDAVRRPVLIVLEDVQWADAALIEVVEAALDRLAGSPVLLVVNGRPEFLDHHPGWIERNGPPIVLGPLPADDTDRLVSMLLEGARLPEPTRSALLDRAGGNPLYAIEFVQLLSDRAEGAGDELGTPESVRSLIGSRLDAVPPGLRRLIHDAAVLGEEFRPDGLGALSGEPIAGVREGIQELERRGVFRPRSDSGLGADAFGFAHSLVREVAYARLPRSVRARRHLEAGRWLERAVGDRAEGFAADLARHFATAAELGGLAGEPRIAADASASAIRWLMEAGARSVPLDPAGAFALFDRALALAPAGSAERLRALERSALMGRRSGALEGDEVLERLAEALSIARELEDPSTTGEILTRVASQRGAMGDWRGSHEALAEAVEILEQPPPGRALARAYAFRAEEEMLAGRTERSRELADRTLALVDEADELAIMALHIRGDARCAEGDPTGLDDLHRAVLLSEQAQDVHDIVTSYSYLGEWRWGIEGPRAALTDFEAGIELAERRGAFNRALWVKANMLPLLFGLGRWAEVLETCDQLLGTREGRLDATLFVQAHAERSRVLVPQGRDEEVIDPADLLRAAEQTEEVQLIAPSLLTAAQIALARGETQEAAARLSAFDRATRDVAPEYRCSELALAVRLSLRAGDPDRARQLVEGSRPRVLRDRLQVRAAEAALAEIGAPQDARALYDEAADSWRTYGHVPEEAVALLGSARCGPPPADGAEDPGSRARALLSLLGASPDRL